MRALFFLSCVWQPAGCARASSRVTLADQRCDPRLSRLAVLLAGAITRLKQRRVLIAGGITLAVVLVMLSFGPVVRAVAHGRAARRHVALEIGSVRPGWFGVHLRKVVRPARGGDLDPDSRGRRAGRPRLAAGRRHDRGPRRRRSRSAATSNTCARSSQPGVRSATPRAKAQRTSRADRARPSSSTGRPSAGSPRESAEAKAEADGLAAVWDHDGLRWSVARAQARLGFAEASLEGGEGEADRAGVLSRARAAALTVTIERAAEGGAAETQAAVLPPGPLPPPVPDGESRRRPSCPCSTCTACAGKWSPSSFSSPTASTRGPMSGSTR